MFFPFIFLIYPLQAPLEEGEVKSGGQAESGSTRKTVPKVNGERQRGKKKVFRYYWTSSRPERVFCPVVSSLIRKLTMVPPCPFSPPAPFFLSTTPCLGITQIWEGEEGEKGMKVEDHVHVTASDYRRT